MRSAPVNLLALQSEIDFVLSIYNEQDEHRYISDIENSAINSLFQFGEAVIPGFVFVLKSDIFSIDWNEISRYRSDIENVLNSSSFWSDIAKQWPEAALFAIAIRDILQQISLLEDGLR